MSTFLIVVLIILAILFLLGPIVLLGTSKKYIRYVKQYSASPLESNATGAEIVDAILEDSSIYDVKVEAVQYENYNSYSPKSETIYLSVFTLSNSSVYSSAVCAHEVGHAKMHQKGDRIVGFWYTLAILDKILCKLVLPFFILCFILSLFGGWAGNLGEILLKLSTLFTALALFYRIISIKNEDSASTIAMQDLEKIGALNKQELKQAQKMLNCALSTYFVEFYERIFYNIITVKKLASKLFKKQDN